MPPSAEPQVVSDLLKQKYAEILKANGIFDEVEKVTTYEPEELKGEHMATATVYVTVEFKNPSTKSKNLFVKKFHDSEVHTAMVKMMRVMEKESTFLNDFIPEAQKFCKQYAGCENLLNFFPKCLHADDEMVVLENLVLDDTFVMLKKEDLQDLFTAKMVLGNLAKFHGCTAAMIEDAGRESFREKHELLISEAFLSNKSSLMIDMFNNGIGTCINIIKGSSVEGGAEAIEKLASYLGKAYSMVEEAILYNPDDKLQVINHGDCWNNNMLFKKDSETGKVNDHIFVDFQITRMGSPNLDIGYFLFTSVKPTIRRKHLEELLQHYFLTLKSTLESLDKKCPITFEELLEDYKRKCTLGYWVYTSFMSIVGAMKEIDMTAMGENPEEMMQIFAQVIDNWINNNRDKASEIATELVASQKEYLELQNSV